MILGRVCNDFDGLWFTSIMITYVSHIMLTPCWLRHLHKKPDVLANPPI